MNSASIMHTQLWALKLILTSYTRVKPWENNSGVKLLGTVVTDISNILATGTPLLWTDTIEITENFPAIVELERWCPYKRGSTAIAPMWYQLLTFHDQQQKLSE